MSQQGRTSSSSFDASLERKMQGVRLPLFGVACVFFYFGFFFVFFFVFFLFFFVVRGPGAVKEEKTSRNTETNSKINFIFGVLSCRNLSLHFGPHGPGVSFQRAGVPQMVPRRWPKHYSFFGFSDFQSLRVVNEAFIALDSPLMTVNSH